MLESQLNFSFVDIVSIHSSVARAKYSSSKIEELANNFLETGGTTKPIIVKMVDFENYEVISGHLEYYAALRAREIDDNFELIRVIIAPSDKEEQIKHQLQLLREANTVESTIQKPDVNLDTHSILEVLKNQDENINKKLYSFELIIKDLIRENKTLHDRVEAFAEEIKLENISFLDRFNLLEENQLRPCLKIVLDGRTDKAIQSILEERSKEKFKSLEDVFSRVKIPRGKKRIKAFGRQTEIKLLERWSSVSFKHLQSQS